MKTIQEIKSELKELTNDYKSGAINYKTYKRKFSIIKNYNSVSNQVKRFGAKVVRKGASYEYIGKNFNCELFLDGCVDDYWTTYYEGDNDKLYNELREFGYRFDTKSELVQYLLDLDMNFQL